VTGVQTCALPILSEALGVPVVETIGIRRGGARQLVEVLDRGDIPTPPAMDIPDDLSLHQQVRELIAKAVDMPSPTAHIDEALDRVLLHPLAGLLVLVLTMFLIFQAVFAWAAPLQDTLDRKSTRL